MCPCVYPQISLDYYDTEENLRTSWFSGKFWNYKVRLFSVISKVSLMICSQQTWKNVMSSKSVCQAESKNVYLVCESDILDANCGNWALQVSEPLLLQFVTILIRWPKSPDQSTITYFLLFFLKAACICSFGTMQYLCLTSLRPCLCFVTYRLLFTFVLLSYFQHLAEGK